MTFERKIFTSLKWIFSFLTGLMIIFEMDFLAALAIFKMNSLSDELLAIVSEVSQTMQTDKLATLVTSPLFLLLIFFNIFLYAVTFLLVRQIFKNLADNSIFTKENVTTAKKISLILLILAFSTSVPNVVLNANDFMNYINLLDLTYFLGSIIVWALSKILEKANLIVEESELTI